MALCGREMKFRAYKPGEVCAAAYFVDGGDHSAVASEQRVCMGHHERVGRGLRDDAPKRRSEFPFRGVRTFLAGNDEGASGRAANAGPALGDKRSRAAPAAAEFEKRMD